MTKSSGFSALLKQWRAARGKSQLSLSLVAGVSAKHIAFLERGRTRPSRDMVLLLAEALDVPLRERNALLHAAGFAAMYTEAELGSAWSEPARKALEFVLVRHEPYPALVIDAAWNVLLSNHAARRLFSRFKRDPRAASTNALCLCFDPAGMRPFITNWPHIAGHLLRRLRREAVGRASDSEVARVLAQATTFEGAADAEATIAQELDLPFIPLVLERDGQRLRLFSLISSFGTALDLSLHDLRIETLFPADAASERALRDLSQRDRATS